MPTKQKTFDAIAFKERAQAEILQQISGMTPSEQAAWFEQAAASGPFADIWRRSRRHPAGKHHAEDEPQAVDGVEDHHSL